jgi:hypothetical protein
VGGCAKCHCKEHQKDNRQSGIVCHDTVFFHMQFSSIFSG